MRFHFPVFILVLFCNRTLSQLDNSSLLYNTVVDTTHERAVFLKVQNLNFLKNNEYYNPIADGYTMFGVQFNPQLGYQLSKNVSIEGGIFLSKDFGNKNFTIVDPTFSFRYTKGDFKMVFGNIDGSLNHQLIEPVYNFERVMTNRLESGVQFALNKKYFDYDLWVDWQNATYRFSNEKEHIWGGLSTNLLKLKNERVELKIPFQMTVYHEGGQIDTLESVGITKNFNYAPGLVLKYFPKSGIIKNFVADGRYVIRTNNYNDTVEVKSQGDGLLANVGFTTKKELDVLLSYWYGNDFYNETGGFLYSSKSHAVSYPFYSERYRSLLILRLTQRITLPGNIALTLRAEPHYDFLKGIFEFSFGLYIRVDEKFWLKK